MIDAKGLQTALGVPADGIIGRGTLDFPEVAFSSAAIGKPARRCGDRFDKRDAAFKALANGSDANAKSRTGRLAVRVLNPVDFHRAHVALIFGKLLKRTSPATIARLVISVGVETVDRVIKARALPHVGEEVDKRPLPAFADRNPASSVFWEVLKPGVLAAPLHSHPYAIGRASLSTTFMAVLKSAVRVPHVACMDARCKRGKLI